MQFATGVMMLLLKIFGAAMFALASGPGASPGVAQSTHLISGYSSWSAPTIMSSSVTSSYFNENSSANTGSTASLTMSAANSTIPSTATPDTQQKFSIIQMVLIAWVASCLALLTVLGNILVMVSFKIDKQLQTISNYFLFSLAVADFLIGTIGMPLSTVYLIMGYWPFGGRICDAWLAVDYLTSNASVLNLLIISFDRYFSVTRPLTYRARRTTRRAGVMISAAWGISLLLWPPWIYAWPYIEGKRTVPEDRCYIQFIETNHYITFGTAIAAFYIPVSIMLFLYWQIWKETEKRQRDLSQLQAGKKDSSRRSNSSDEAVDVEEWKRMRAESCICQDHTDQLPSCPAHPRQSIIPQWCFKRWQCLARLFNAFVGFCRVDRDADDPEELEDEHASPGCGTPASIETPLQSSVSRCTSLNVIRDPLAQTPTRRNDSVVSPIQNTTAVTHHTTTNTTDGSNGKLPSDSVYTILIRIPGDSDGKNASIRMIQEPGPLPPLPVHPKAKLVSSNPDNVFGTTAAPGAVSGTGTTAGTSAAASSSTAATAASAPGSSALARRPSSAQPPLGAKVIPKPLQSKGSTGTISSSSNITSAQPKRKKKKNLEKKQEKKAAKTLSAILLAFIVTWTPYNILVLLKTVMSDENDTIPEVLWDISYYLCYINSTINPMCYALCNASFRRTYVRILTCKWDNSRRQAVNRGYYN